MVVGVDTEGVTLIQYFFILPLRRILYLADEMLDRSNIKYGGGSLDAIFIGERIYFRRFT